MFDTLFKKDVYTLGVLVLNCIEEISISKRDKNLDEATLHQLTSITDEHYSKFFSTLIKNMVEINAEKRWSIHQIQKYLTKMDQV